MFRTTKRSTGAALIAFGLTTFVVACGDKVITNTNVIPLTNVFTQTNLVSDAAGAGAVTVDPQLINPWGIAFGSTGLLWVANNGSGTATIYDQGGVKQSLTVSLNPAATAAAPTGIVLNTTADFMVGGTPATFIFDGRNAAFNAWNPPQGATAVSGVIGSASAVYTSLATGVQGGANRLYAADFFNGQVAEFDATFSPVTPLPGAFTDASLPAGYAPFGIANIGGQLYVTYAKQLAPANVDPEAGVGNGIIDVYNTDGSFVRRFASNGVLNAPWAVVQAPAGFGQFAGDILIGNFGNGQIGAYDPASGNFLDWLRDGSGNPITNSGLWGLAFAPAPNATALYFAAGIGNETHGLVGRIDPVTP